MKLAVWHNIMWSRYKAVVLSSLAAVCTERCSQLQVFQIAETENDRVALSPVDASIHQYPYELLFNGPYESIPRLALYWKVAKITWFSDAELTILAGYSQFEYWIQAIILIVRGKTFACFCDSTLYDNKQRYFIGLLKRVFFHACSGIFCYGDRAAEYVSHYGATPEKIIRRCQAAALSDHYSRQAALENRRVNHSSVPQFLYVGRFSSEKSIDSLLLAFHLVLQQLPMARLVLIGGGPEKDRLIEISNKLQLNGAVEFAGAKYGEELFTEYSKATCLVLPSFREPWGLVVNEALSYGCPVVVSHRCGCVPELVNNKKSGYVYQWNDTEDLVEKLIDASKFLIGDDTAKHCLDQIEPFSPHSAALSIFEGSLTIQRRIGRE